MTWRCCKLHDLIDQNIERLRLMAIDQSTSEENRNWAKKVLIESIEKQLIVVERTDGTFHTRKPENR